MSERTGRLRSARRLAVGIVRVALRSPIVTTSSLRLLRAISRRCATVFMLHRFEDHELGSLGMSASSLRRSLQTLRQQGVEFLSLRDLMTRIEAKDTPTTTSVVFTVDDGYLDFASVAAPIFAEFDCPVTVFVTSEVVTGDLWYWWDRLEYAFLRSTLQDVAIEIGDRTHRYALGTELERRLAAHTFAEVLKFSTDAERRRVSDTIGSLTNVDIPARPPAQFRVLSWEEIRRLEKGGVAFGPHSATHPIFSRLDATVARAEVEGSWAAMRANCAEPTPIFCYPNGTFDSFSDRDVRIVREAGLRGAVAFDPRRVETNRVSPEGSFRIPRFVMPEDPVEIALIASGRSFL